MLFQTSMVARKSRCDVPNGTTYPQMFKGFHLFDQQTSIVLHRIKLTQRSYSLFLGDKQLQMMKLFHKNMKSLS
jgi:hypothetical protein